MARYSEEGHLRRGSQERRWSCGRGTVGAASLGGDAEMQNTGRKVTTLDHTGGGEVYGYGLGVGVGLQVMMRSPRLVNKVIRNSDRVCSLEFTRGEPLSPWPSPWRGRAVSPQPLGSRVCYRSAGGGSRGGKLIILTLRAEYA